MNIDEYIKSAVSAVSSANERKTIAAELHEHYEDRLEYYTAAGYDRFQAEQMALERMGSPETVAFDMAKLHSPKARTVFNVLSIMVLGLELVVFLVATIDCECRLSYHLVSGEFVVTLSILLFAFLSIRMRNSFVLGTARNFYFLSMLFWPLNASVSRYTSGRITSGIVTAFVYLITGKADEIRVFTADLGDIKVSWPLVAASIAFYALVFAVLCVATALQSRLEKGKCSLKAKHALDKIGKTLPLLFAFIAMVYGAFLFVAYDFFHNDVKYTGAKLVVIEAVKPYDYTQSGKIAGKQYDFHFPDFGSNYAVLQYELTDDSLGDVDYEDKEKRFDNLLTYRARESHITYTPEKDFVYVSIVYGTSPEAEQYSADNWYETSSENEIFIDKETNGYPLNTVKISVLPQEK